MTDLDVEINLIGYETDSSHYHIIDFVDSEGRLRRFTKQEALEFCKKYNLKVREIQ